MELARCWPAGDRAPWPFSIYSSSLCLLKARPAASELPQPRMGPGVGRCEGKSLGESERVLGSGLQSCRQVGGTAASGGEAWLPCDPPAPSAPAQSTVGPVPAVSLRLGGSQEDPPVTEGPSPRTPLGPGAPSPTSPVLALPPPQKVGAPEECSPGLRGLFGLWEALWGCGWGPASGHQAQLVAGLS